MPLVISPSSDPVTEDLHTSSHVAFIQDMPVTKTIDAVTVGNLAKSPSCASSQFTADPAEELHIMDHPDGSLDGTLRNGGGGATTVGMSSPLTITPGASMVTFQFAPTTLLAGHSYSFDLSFDANYTCPILSQTTWAHNGPQVNSGPGSCEIIPTTISTGAGDPLERLWHVQGSNDKVAPDCDNELANDPFDPSMPGGWLVSASFNANDIYPVTSRGSSGASAPCGYTSLASKGVVEVYWRPDPTTPTVNDYICQWTQFTAPGQTVTDGWYYGLPWRTDRSGAPRDVYLRLDVAQPTASEALGDPSGSTAGSYPVSPNLHRTCAADPVDCATGNLFESFTDLSVGGLGLGLDLARTYNSQAAVAASAAGPFGYGWSAAYREYLETDSVSGAVTVHHADGSTARFTPNPDGSYLGRPWVQSQLSKNADGSFSYVLPDHRSFAFDSSGRLLSEADRNGNKTSLGYSGSGQLQTVTDPSGRSITFAYNPDATVKSATDPAGLAVQYGYDGSGDLTSVKDVGGGTTQFGYDSSHRLTSITDPRGGQVQSVYDASNRVTSQTDARGHTTTWSYDANETKITDPQGVVTDEHFSNGQLTSITRAQGTSIAATTTFAYDNNLNRTSVTDPNGHQWTYGYDAQNNLSSIVDPLIRQTHLAHDSNRNLTQITSPSGMQTQMGYDANNNLASVTRNVVETNQQAITSYSYDPKGEPTKVTDPLSHNWQFGYDSQGDLASATSPAGHKTTSTFDVDSRKTSTTSARGNDPGANAVAYTAQIQSDAFGDPTKITDPGGHATTLVYDGNRNLTDVTDRDGRHTQYSYDAAGELTQVTRGDGSTQKTAYDSNGRITSQTDGLNNPTAYGYDPLGRLTSVTDPLSRSETFGYDAAGNRTGITDQAGQQTTLGYDAASQLTSVSYQSGNPAPVSFTYDGDGRRTGMSDATGSTSYAYDSLGRLKSSTSGAGQQTSYSYDLASQLTAVAYPPARQALNLGGSGNFINVATGTVARTYDSDGNLTTVTDWLGNKTTFGYDSEGHLTAETRPNGTSGSYSYDANGAMTGLNDVGGAISYGRTAEELLASTTGGLVGSQTYGYDGAARLTGLNSTAGAFRYDAADNATKISSATVSGAPLAATTQTFDAANELLSTAQNNTQQTGYAYDMRGDRTSATASATHSSYTYDQARELIGYSSTTNTTGLPGGPTSTMQAQYTNDGDGLRQTKTVNNSLTNETYDLSGSLPLMIEDGPNAYITGPEGLPIEQIAPGSTVQYFSHDQQGSTTALTDAQGHTVATYTYDSYGKQTSPTSSATNPFGYDGQYTDNETGLQYLRARYYDPTTGQLLTRDPLAATTRQPYSYAGDNPIDSADPTGLMCALGYCLGFHPLAGLEGLANFGAGAANVVVSAISLGHLGVPQPFCGGLLGVSYTIGEGTAVAEAALGTAGAAGEAGAANGAGVVFRTDTSHIFRDAAGHLAEDTPENRALLQGAVKPDNLVGETRIPGGAIQRYRQSLPDGREVWVNVRNGREITNGGVN